MRSWRKHTPDPETIRRVTETPRLVLAAYHGTLLHLLAFAPLAAIHGRRLVVMTSPSYDGGLLAALLKRFGIGSVRGSSRSRAIRGAQEFIWRIREGDIGVIAVDGPRGPCCVAKPGFLKIASFARAHLLLATTSASRGISFGTWDRAHLPLPLARVELSLQLLPPPPAGSATQELPEIQEKLIGEAMRMASPVLPSHFRGPERS